MAQPNCLLLSLLFGAGSLWADQQADDAITMLRNRIAEQERQIESLRQALEEQKRLLDSLAPRPAPAPQASSVEQQKPPSPLSIPIGSALFTPGGFLDLTILNRTTNVGSGTPTAFGTIPFNNSAAGHLGDTRYSAQGSRLSLRVDTQFRATKVTALAEADFLGNAPANLAVSSNSGSLRMRHFYVNLDRARFSILGGQTWSLLTPGRKGISANSQAVFFGQNLDPNYQVGLAWSRDPQLRFVYKANEQFTVAASVEAPEQYNAGTVIYPKNLRDTYPAQFNDGSANSRTPNDIGDIVAKAAYDNNWHGRNLHVELVGMHRRFKAYNHGAGRSYTQPGFGGSVNGLLEVRNDLNLVVTTFASSGGGRYIFGLGPDAAAHPDGDLTPVHAYSGIAGFEYTHRPRVSATGSDTLFYGYYGGAYFQRVVVIDQDGSLAGFGFSGSSTNSNRNLHQATFGVNQNIWRNPNYGALRVLSQYSYLLRTPWSVPANHPKNAKVNMVYVALRYELP